MSTPPSDRADVRLVALDFDLTIYDHAAPARTAALQTWFERLDAMGVCIGLASGRNLAELRQPLTEVGVPWGEPFPHYVICNEGRIVTNTDQCWPGAATWNTQRTKRVAEANTLLRDHFEDIAAWAKRESIPITRPIVCGDQGINIVLDTPASAQRALERLEAQITDAASYHLSRNHHIILALPRDLDKGAAVAKLAQIKGLDPSQVLVIGDNLNDLSMLSAERGFIAATPANADPRIAACVKQRGGIVAGRRASLGVADIFQRVFGSLPAGAAAKARG